MLHVSLVGASPLQDRALTPAITPCLDGHRFQSGCAETRAERRLQRAAMIAAVAREVVWWKRHA
jgi:hypothetical protein